MFVYFCIENRLEILDHRKKKIYAVFVKQLGIADLLVLVEYAEKFVCII